MDNNKTAISTFTPVFGFSPLYFKFQTYPPCINPKSIVGTKKYC